jgi:HK97 family phage prohead protease
MPPLTLERKQVALDALQLLDTGTGTLAGYASVFNAVDSYGDTIAPGAYRDTLAKFLADGFIAWGHDTMAPVAYPTAAREDDHGLWVEATFHSTAEAQEARRIMQERAAAGKRSGLSIGYYTKRAEMTSDGIRRLLDIDLVEVSLVMVPADDHARVALVKGADLETGAEQKPYANEHACRLMDPAECDRFRRANGDREHDGKSYDVIYGHRKADGKWAQQAFRYPKNTWSAAEARTHCGSHDGMFEAAAGGDGKAADCGCLTGHGLDYDAHADRITAALSEFVTRNRAGSVQRVKEGRAISTARRERMASVSGSLRVAADEIDAMLTETAPPERDKAAAAPTPVGYDARLQREVIGRRLRLRGVHVETETTREPIAG